MKLKGLHLADVAEIWEAVTDKLKKVQKDKFLAASQNIVVYIPCSALRRMTRNTVAHFVISNLSLPGYELT